MSKLMQEYKKALQNAKVHNSQVLVHTIDIDKVAKAYRDYQNYFNDFCDIDKQDIESLSKYEKWLTGD